MISPKGLQENADGWAYHRGFSKQPDTTVAAGRHANVFLRLGHMVQDDKAFFRCILHAVDRAVGSALVASNGQVGKFKLVFAGQTRGNTVERD